MATPSDLIDSEHTYIQSLGVLLEYFITPLKEDFNLHRPLLLPRGDSAIALFFSTFENMYTVCNSFMKELETRFMDGMDISGAFIQYAPLFRLYGQYAGSYIDVGPIFSQQMEKETFYDFMQRKNNELPQGSKNFQDLMKLPLDRVKEYQEYFSFLARTTQQDHPEYENIKNAESQIEVASKKIQEAFMIKESRDKIRELERTWNGHKFAKPGRRYIREGPLVKQCRKGPVQYQFILFSDALVYGSQSALGSCKHHRTLDLGSTRVNDIASDDQIWFEIFNKDKSFRVQSSSVEDKFNWIMAISEAIAQLMREDEAAFRDDLAAAPVWVPDSHVTQCQICKNKFSLMNRRHHCRRCGNVVCNPCSQHQYPLNVINPESSSTKKVRVCNNCVEELGREARISRTIPSTIKHVEALYEYTPAADSSSEIALQAGEHLIVFDTQNGWCRGENNRGQQGWFPENFVKELDKEDADEEEIGDLPQIESSKTKRVESRRIESRRIESRRVTGRFVEEEEDIRQRSLPIVASDDTRGRVAIEILTTERSYVYNLRALVKVFIEPILDYSSSERNQIGSIVRVADNTNNMAVFLNNVETIYNLNCKLLQDLEDRVQFYTSDGKLNSQEILIGDLFINSASLFRMYAQYSTMHEFAAKVFDEYSKKEEFQNFLLVCSQDPRSNQQSLSSFLIMPIQRIPRYELLLRELKKKTPEQHPDFDKIDRALDSMKEVAIHVNEAIRARENREKIQELEKRWSGYRFYQPGRFFIREGPLTKQCRRSPKIFQFILFSDVLIYGSETGASIAECKYKHHRTLDLKTMSVKNIPDNMQENAFEIQSSSKSFIVMTEDGQSKTSWLNSIQQAIEKCRGAELQNGEAAPVWIPDRLVQNCTLCSANFSIMNRRHHCRKCGKIVCSGCSPNRVLLQNIDSTKPVRVCKECSDELGINEDTQSPDVPTTETNESTPETNESAPINGSLPTPEVAPHPLVQQGSQNLMSELLQKQRSFKSVKNPEVHSVGSSRRGSHCIVLDEKSNIHALFAYVGTTDAELSLTAGEELIAEQVNDDWLLVSNSRGDQGWVPTAYTSYSNAIRL